MAKSFAVLALVGSTGGCSLIYNPDHLTKDDAKTYLDASLVDAQPDARFIADADPSMLVIDDVWPKTIYEGQGQGGSRPATIIIHGHHIVDGFTVDLQPSSGLTLGTPMRSQDGDYIAVQVTTTIDGSNATTAVPLTITVTQPMASRMLAGVLAYQPLPSLTGASASVDSRTLATTRYAQIDVGDITFSDATKRATFDVVSSIHVTGTIHAAGSAGTTGGSGAAAGPGGCKGGDLKLAGGCSGVDGGGAGAAGNNGGGGGGYGADASTGGGGTLAGKQHGNAQLYSYDGTGASDVNQSSGGGGGNAGTLANAGSGGGGGGTVELTAGGTIDVATVDASGGAGGPATNLVVTNAGGGGGGSGGVILVRSAAGTIAATSLNVSPGTGGAPAGSGGAGGTGSIGRIRCDVPGPLPSTTPAAHRGVSFAANTPAVFTVASPMITIYGSEMDTVDMYLVDGAGTTHEGEPKGLTFPAGGMKTLQVSLVEGYNKLCAVITPGARGGLAETCIEVAYLYQAP